MSKIYKKKVPIGPILGSIVLLALLGVIFAKFDIGQPGRAQENPTPVATQPATGPSVADSADRPSKDVVWDFEEATLIVNPTERSVQLGRVATASYIADNQSIESREEAKDVTLSVQRDVSHIDWQPAKEHDVYYIISHPVIQTKRGAAVLNTFSAEPHATKWIKTPDGWRVDEETIIELR